MTYEEWEDKQNISGSSPEAYYAEQAWNAAITEVVKFLSRVTAENGNFHQADITRLRTSLQEKTEETKA